MDYDTYIGFAGYLGCQAYMMLPFAAELRCLFDFVFTKTALDVFQFWQLFNYHMELYVAHFGNQSYVIKVMGVPVTFEDYLLGYVILILLCLALIGPIYFFSAFSGFSALNPVLQSHIEVALLVNKTLSLKNLVDRTVPAAHLRPINDPY